MSRKGSTVDMSRMGSTVGMSGTSGTDAQGLGLLGPLGLPSPQSGTGGLLRGFSRGLSTPLSPTGPALDRIEDGEEQGEGSSCVNAQPASGDEGECSSCAKTAGGGELVAGF
eukprot:CAMPEP_0202912890 /NCGR_PEP_ID=MMETSP1392-20130828/58973_1 /ASSEMBLY_ACC=CAM_ASM_000868 /TAXON_ID=225041 /ORGANISM="Chlamydomonas chlamydogama, Strain SAG 11-48b" /LENGTH=111 /DNA_ID=CAMNT_0049603969 /DNA_START=155 /DNA_END=490 /DNA_ORIENTATION=-